MELEHLNGPVGKNIQPEHHEQTHKVGYDGQKLEDIADLYGVRPEAIRNHPDNAPLFAEGRGGRLLAGDALTIPPAPMSVAEEAVDNGAISPGFGSSNSEFGGNGFTWNPGDGTVKLTVEQERELALGQKDAKGRSVPGTAQADIRQIRTASVTITPDPVFRNGNTEFELAVEAETGRAVEVGVGGRKDIGAEAEGTHGARIRYKVILPGDQHGFDPGMLRKVDPTDPSTIPDGATVTLDQQQFEKTNWGASLRYLSMKEEGLDARGTTLAITRHGDAVTVLTGPTELSETFSGIGPGRLPVQFGQEITTYQARLHTATFDLSAGDGQAAYRHFMETGQVAHETAGVGNVQTTDLIGAEGRPRLKGAGALEGIFSLAGGEYRPRWSTTTFPDGSYATSMQIEHPGHVPYTITARYDAQGNEILSERSYRFAVQADESNVQMLNMVASGGTSQEGIIEPGQTMTMTMDEAQMQAYMEQVRQTSDLLGGQRNSPAYLDSGEPLTDGRRFVANLLRGQDGEPFNFANMLFQVSDAADGDVGGGFRGIDMQIDVA